MLERLQYPTALHTSVNSAVVFTGAGTNDLTVSGSSFFATSRSYVVTIDGSETYKWSNDGGSTWEATGQSIVAGQFVELINAEGEKEGIKIRFASRSGHVATNNWAFSTTGQVVPDTATLLATYSLEGAEYLNLYGEYSKGTETGIQIYIALPVSLNGSILYRPSRPNAAAGVLSHYPEIFELTSSANFCYTYETNGRQFVKVYAVKKGGTVSGTFTLISELASKRK